MINFLSYHLDEKTPTYADGPHFTRQIDKCIEHGASCNQFTFTVGNHIGTHLDSPLHFDAHGKSVTDYPADFWSVESISLVHVPENDLRDDLLVNLEKYKDQIKPNSELVLVKTGFCHIREQERYWKKNPGITASSADFLRSHCSKIRFLGLDVISLTSFEHREEGKKAHQAFLQKSEKSILLIEDMDLRELIQTPSKVLISPLRIFKADGGPVTVFAWE